MRLHRHRRRCDRLIRALGLPTPLDPEMLCRHLSQQRGRRVRLLPMPLPSNGASGFWLATETTDYIITDSGTVAPHQLHILLHQLAHMLLGHGGSIVEALQQLLLPELGLGAGGRGARTHYDLDEEWEAEMLASQLQERMGQWRSCRVMDGPARSWRSRRVDESNGGSAARGSHRHKG